MTLRNSRLAALSAALVLCPLLAAPALAQTDPHPDGIGIYFDGGGDVHCLQGVEHSARAYLLLTRPTLGLLKGWECGLEFTGTSVMDTVALPEIQHADGSWRGWYETPRPLSPGTNILAMFNLTGLAGSGGHFYVTPPMHFEINLPGYWATVPQEVVPLRPSSGAFERPVAAFNAECPGLTPLTSTTWGTLKTLYR